MKQLFVYLRQYMRLSMAPLLGLGLLTGCFGNAPQAVITPEIQLDQFSSLRLDARKLQIVDNWQMPIQPPYVEHTLNPTPASLIVDWASRTLVPVSGSGELVVDIKRASVMVTELPKSKKLLDVFQDQQERKIRVDIEADLMWIQPVGNKQALIKLQSSASTTVEESATPNSFDAAMKTAVNDAIEALDAQARQKISTLDGLSSQ